MGYSGFWLKMGDVESKSIPHELPSSHWLKATGKCVLERYLSATMQCFLVNNSAFRYIVLFGNCMDPSINTHLLMGHVRLCN